MISSNACLLVAPRGGHIDPQIADNVFMGVKGKPTDPYYIIGILRRNWKLAALSFSQDGALLTKTNQALLFPSLGIDTTAKRRFIS